MYVEARAVGVNGKRAQTELVALVCGELYPFEARLQRVQVSLEPSPGGHVCRLRAWSQRGQMIAVERRAASVRAAVDGATGALKRALANSRTMRSSRGRAGRILLVLDELDAKAPTLAWARALSSAFDAELDVCRARRDVPSPASLPGRAWLEATRQLLAARREARRFCSAELPRATLLERALPGASGYVQGAAALARERGVTWIIVPASPGAGSRAAALARAAGCPVLVARAPTSRSTLLVGTGVDANNRPALACAARLSAALNAPVLAFHNVHVRSAVQSRIPQATALMDAWREIRDEGHDPESERVVPELDLLLGHGAEPVAALLEQARREDAEMIVVSASETDPAAGAPAEMAADVVDRALRSVLVVPVDAAGAASQVPRKSGPASDRTEPSSITPSEGPLPIPTPWA